MLKLMFSKARLQPKKRCAVSALACATVTTGAQNRQAQSLARVAIQALPVNLLCCDHERWKDPQEFHI
jgi:hypothetical protein